MVGDFLLLVMFCYSSIHVTVWSKWHFWWCIAAQRGRNRADSGSTIRSDLARTRKRDRSDINVSETGTSSRNWCKMTGKDEQTNENMKNLSGWERAIRKTCIKYDIYGIFLIKISSSLKGRRGKIKKEKMFRWKYFDDSCHRSGTYNYWIKSKWSDSGGGPDLCQVGCLRIQGLPSRRYQIRFVIQSRDFRFWPMVLVVPSDNAGKMMVDFGCAGFRRELAIIFHSGDGRALLLLFVEIF